MFDMRPAGNVLMTGNLSLGTHLASGVLTQGHEEMLDTILGWCIS